MPLIKLLGDPEDDSLPPPPPLLRGGNFPIEDLLLELRDQKLRAKRREAAFLSILAHLCLIVLLLLTPRFFQPVQLHRNQAQPPEQLTYLEMPKDLITPKKPVHPKALSDQDRHFNRSTPITRSLSAPVTRPAPRMSPSQPARGRTEPRPPAPQPAGRPAPAEATAKPAPAAPRPAPKPSSEAGLKLENVPKPALHPKLQLNLGAADSLQRAMAAAARERSSHSGGVTVTSPLPAPPSSGNASAAPGQTGAGVQILTDTQGVNFDPYLRQVVEIVRRNWYAVMPETVYLGTQGRVVVIFNINNNGSVPGIKPVSLSGTASLDHAAEASISASNPFPPLPKQFSGPFITLQFSFFYNLNPGQ